MAEKRNIKEDVVWEILDRMKQSGLVICTSEDRYELANNTLASRVEKKVEAENSLLRNMRVVIRDHMSSNELLDRQYLEHIAPFIARLELDREQQLFVKKSEEAIEKRRRRRRTLMLLGVLFLLGMTTVTTYLAKRNQGLFEDADARRIRLLESEKELNETIKELRESRSELNEKMIELENANLDLIKEKDKVDSALDAAIRARMALRFANDSIARINRRLSNSKYDLERALAKAEDAERVANIQRDSAQQAREQALKEKRQSDLLAISINAAVRSQSITEADLQSLISKQAYELYLEYTLNSEEQMDPEGNHPYIFDALRQSLRNLAPDIPQSIKAHDGSINDILMAPDGRSFFTAGSDGRIKRWEVDRWNRIGAPETQAEALLGVDSDIIYESLSLSENKNNLLIAGQHNILQLYNFPEGFIKENFLLPNSFRQNDKVYVTAFKDSADSTEAMAISKDWYYTTPGALSSKSILITDFFEKRKMSSRANTSVKINDKVYGLTAQTLYEQGRLFIQLQVMNKGVGNIQEINFDQKSNYGDAVALGAQQSGNNGIIAIGLENGHLIVGKADLLGDPIWRDQQAGILTFKPHKAAISDIVFSQNGTYMAVASYDGTVSIWDLRYFLNATYQPLIIDDYRNWVKSLAFSKDDRLLIAGTQDGRLHFWNIHSPDYADFLCERLEEQLDFPNFDRIDDKTWRQFFGTNIKKDDKICR
ncbi:MAG: hypothetical protein AAF985_15740 [Bacteroidota bacterium]